MEEEEEDVLDIKEDLKNIEGSTEGAGQKPLKPVPGPKKIKLTKNYTVPDIEFCKSCMKDVFSCCCKQL